MFLDEMDLSFNFFFFCSIQYVGFLLLPYLASPCTRAGVLGCLATKGR